MAKKNPEDDPKSCASCIYFRQDAPKDDAGFCHRYPPRYIGDEETGGWTFAIVIPDEWCGEFQRRTQ